MSSMNSATEAEFVKAKTLLFSVSWPLRLVGIWPTDHTVSCRIKFCVFMTWFVTTVIMEYGDFIMAIGDLQSMVKTLSETGIQTMIITRLFMFKFHYLVPRIITRVQEDVADENYSSIEEKKIYVFYSSIASHFGRVSLWFSALTSIGWYLDPWQHYLIARLNNEPAILTTPWRVYTFFNTTSFGRTVSVCIYQIPLCSTGTLYMSSFNVILVAVMNVCGKMAILSQKIVTSRVDNEISSIRLIRQLVDEHLDLIAIGETIDDAFYLVFLFELTITTFLIGLVSYITMVNFDDSNAMAFISSLIYAIVLILIVYGNCMMGQYLQDESAKLLNAFYYHYDWDAMPLSHKKALLLCMTRAQIPITLSAGKFYIYSLSSFTSIMKTSGAYISMLRTLI